MVPVWKFVLFLTVPAIPQVRGVPTVPQGGTVTGIPPVRLPQTGPSLGQGTSIRLTPSLGGSLSAPSLGQTQNPGLAGNQQTSSSSQFVPDETSRQVQSYLDQLVRNRIRHIPAIEKTHRTRR